MTGPEHFAAAERELRKAEQAYDHESGTFHLLRAQVHATLALAEATRTRPVTP